MKYAVRSLVIWVSQQGHFDTRGHFTVKTHCQRGPPLGQHCLCLVIVLAPTIPLSLSFLPFTRLLFLYDFHSLFNPFSASLASCLIYFLSIHYPHVSHSHLFFYASISASSFITEVIFILPFHFPFYLCFQSAFLKSYLFYSCNLCLYIFFIMFSFISQITTFVITKFLLF